MLKYLATPDLSFTAPSGVATTSFRTVLGRTFDEQGRSSEMGSFHTLGRGMWNGYVLRDILTSVQLKIVTSLLKSMSRHFIKLMSFSLSYKYVASCNNT